MASSTKPSMVGSFHSTSRAGGTPAFRTEVVEPRVFKFGLGQVIVLWSVVSGCMVMVFLFGFYAGREQGVKVALEEQGVEAVRLPVANPIVEQKTADDSLAFPGSEVAGGNVGGKDESWNTAAKELQKTETSPQLKPEQEIVVDFSPNNKNSLVVRDVPHIDKPIEKAPINSAPIQAAILEGTANLTNSKPNTGQKLTPGWYIQISAARNSADANARVSKLKNAGFSVGIEEAKVNKSTYYRVVVGPYPTKEAAEASRNKVEQVKAAVGESFVKRLN